MRAVPLALVALVLLFGCRGHPETTSARGAEPAAHPVAQPAPWRSRRPTRPPVTPEIAPAAPTETVTVTEVAEEEEPDDTEARVRAAFGYPAECIGPSAVPADVEHFTVSLTVAVTTTGVVTRATVASSALTAEARACLVSRAEHMRVTGPVREAPRTVSTTFEYTAAARPVRAEVEPPPAQPALPPGTRAPAAVLPAVAGEAPRDVQPPARTLPAVTGDGPAPGLVPPSFTLPAVGSAEPRR